MQSQSQPPPRGGFFTIGAWQSADDRVVKVYEVTDMKKGSEVMVHPSFSNASFTIS